MEDIGGKHKLYVNSMEFYLKGDPTYDVGGERRTVINTVSGKCFTKVENVNSSISGTLAHVSSLNLVDLRKTKDATVMLECPNGKTIVFPHASFVDDMSVNGSEGEVSFNFSGDPAEELNE